MSVSCDCCVEQIAVNARFNKAVAENLPDGKRPINSRSASRWAKVQTWWSSARSGSSAYRW